MTATRTVEATWEGGLRCSVRAGRFLLTVDEPHSAGGTDAGPQPTDLFLASVASCFTLALAHTAAKRGIPLGALDVHTTGVYDGPRFAEIVLTVRCDPEPADLDQLLAAAERVCYVSNTLRRGPTLLVRPTGRTAGEEAPPQQRDEDDESAPSARPPGLKPRV